MLLLGTTRLMAVIGVICVLGLVGCGRQDVVQSERKKVVEQNKNIDSVIIQNECNTKVAQENRELITDFLVQGEYTGEVQHLIAGDILLRAQEVLLEGNEAATEDDAKITWDSVTEALDGVSTDYTDLWFDYQNKIDVFEDNQVEYDEYLDDTGELQIAESVVGEQEWVFERYKVIEEGCYMVANSLETVQFLVIEGESGYKLVAKVYWSDGKMQRLERVLQGP